MDIAQEKLQQVRTKLDQIPVLQQAEDAVKVPKEFLVLGGGLLFVCLLFFGVGASTLCNVIGFVYPSFKSLQAIESKNKGDDKQWLVYWTVYGFFSIIQVFEGFLCYYIPFYYSFKLAFLCWAFLPQTQGAKFLYDSFLKDFLKKNESKIDSALADAKKTTSEVATEASAATGEAVASVTESITTSATAESKKDS